MYSKQVYGWGLGRRSRPSAMTRIPGKSFSPQYPKLLAGPLNFFKSQNYLLFWPISIFPPKSGQQITQKSGPIYLFQTDGYLWHPSQTHFSSFSGSLVIEDGQQQPTLPQTFEKYEAGRFDKYLSQQEVGNSRSSSFASMQFSIRKELDRGLNQTKGRDAA